MSRREKRRAPGVPGALVVGPGSYFFRGAGFEAGFAAGAAAGFAAAFFVAAKDVSFDYPVRRV